MMTKQKSLAEDLHGPFYVVLNPDGSIHRIQDRPTADPCIFATMGPYDNHSGEGRRVERVYLRLVAAPLGIPRR